MSRKRIRLTWLVFALLIAGAAFVSHVFRNQTAEKPEKRTKLVFATVPATIDAPSHIAWHNRYFEAEGLDVRLIMNPDGKTSLRQLFDGEADIATVTGTPVIYSSFRRQDFYICGNILPSKIHFVLARKDRGIRSAADLKGKKVAVMPGTSASFFMDTFLICNGLKPGDVEIVNLNAPAMVSAIEKGEVAAMFCWQPFILMAQKKLGENGIILPSKDILTGSWLVIAMKDYVRQHPHVIKAFLRGIIRAENFIRDHRDEGITIHSTVTGTAREISAPLLRDMIFDISLSQSLLTNLEDQARWAISYGYTDADEIPNFLNLIWSDALETVKPHAVTMIR